MALSGYNCLPAGRFRTAGRFHTAGMYRTAGMLHTAVHIHNNSDSAHPSVPVAGMYYSEVSDLGMPDSVVPDSVISDSEMSDPAASDPVVSDPVMSDSFFPDLSDLHFDHIDIPWRNLLSISYVSVSFP